MATSTVYNYDSLGRLISVAFNDGGTITYNYDTEGNRTSVVEVADATDITRSQLTLPDAKSTSSDD